MRNTLPSGRPLGRSLAAMHPPRLETRQAIMLRAKALRIVRSQIEKNYSGAMGRQSVGEDRVPNVRPRRIKIKGSKRREGAQISTIVRSLENVDCK